MDEESLHWWATWRDTQARRLYAENQSLATQQTVHLQHLPPADPSVWNQPCTVSPDGDELELFDDDNFDEEEDFSVCDNPDCELCYP